MKIEISPNEFFDFVFLSFFDIMNNLDKTTITNQNFLNMLNTFKQKGIELLLLQYYLQSDPKMRIKYNFIKNSFYKQNEDNIIKLLKEMTVPKKISNIGDNTNDNLKA